MLNFKQFLANASAFYNGSNEMDPNGQPRLPQVTMEIPTISTQAPVEIFRVLRKGRAYEICAENNISWYCPAQHYIYLMHQGKAPKEGDKVHLEFYKDGSVKNYKIVHRHESGLGDQR